MAVVPLITVDADVVTCEQCGMLGGRRGCELIVCWLSRKGMRL